MTKPLLMMGLPNGGTTWLAALLAKHIPGCRYYDKEFFNPICNLKHEEILRRNFGSELVSCYRNIATFGDQFIDGDIRATWGSESYTFTKENLSPFKLPVFVRHFHCFALLRSATTTFPPSRVRVWSFFEHAWFALRNAGFDLSASSTMDRAVEAHRIMHARIVKDCARLKVPVIDYDWLMRAAPDDAAEVIGRAVPGINAVSAAAEIAETRSKSKAKPGSRE